MKQAQIIHQYIWLINTLKAHRALTLDELKSKWRDDEVADGNPLNRSTLTRHRRAIFDMFGIIIEADASTYKYSIRNANVLTNGSIEQWLYSTLSVHGVLVESVDVVREFFWGDSSMAVIFGVCRDCFKYADNMSKFEHEFGCTEGLISNTFRNNPYMRMTVGKWGQQGAKQRVLRLVEAYKNAVEERMKA